MSDKRKVIYYRDELNDEFSVAKITPRKIDGSYSYDLSSKRKRLAQFFWHRLVAPPLAFLYVKLAFRHKVVNRSLLKKFGKQAYFLYGNHTQDIGDALIPNLLYFPQKTSVIVHPNNVSMPILGRITPYLGAIPLPDDEAAYRNFFTELRKRVEEKQKIVIYPEAHIWPYYTGIRPFSDASFFYPVKYKTPVLCFTNTYQKRWWSKKPRIVTYVDGPFFADESLPPRKQRAELRDRVYERMCERAKRSTVMRIQYIKEDDR